MGVTSLVVRGNHDGERDVRGALWRSPRVHDAGLLQRREAAPSSEKTLGTWHRSPRGRGLRFGRHRHGRETPMLHRGANSGEKPKMTHEIRGERLGARNNA